MFIYHRKIKFFRVNDSDVWASGPKVSALKELIPPTSARIQGVRTYFKKGVNDSNFNYEQPRSVLYDDVKLSKQSSLELNNGVNQLSHY
jgi:hypothetical protein